jgi:hypothetical protein
MTEGQGRDRGRQLARTAAVDSGLLEKRHSLAFYPIFGYQFDRSQAINRGIRVQRRQTRTTWF